MHDIPAKDFSVYFCLFFLTVNYISHRTNIRIILIQYRVLVIMYYIFQRYSLFIEHINSFLFLFSFWLREITVKIVSLRLNLISQSKYSKFNTLSWMSECFISDIQVNCFFSLFNVLYIIRSNNIYFEKCDFYCWIDIKHNCFYSFLNIKRSISIIIISFGTLKVKNFK